MDAELALPEGLTARAATMGDSEAVTALIAAHEVAVDGEAEIVVEDVRSDWRRASFELSRDTVLAFDGDRLVAAAQVLAGRYAEIVVHPDECRRGIGSTLLAWTERRARKQGGAVVGQTVTDANVAGRDLLLAHGYRPSWKSWILTIELQEEPAPPSLPDGVRIRDMEPGGDEREIHAVIEDAFAEWGSRPRTPFADWAAWSIGRDGFEPWLMPVAVEGSEIVGTAYCIHYPGEAGWVQQLAVRRSHRGRGLGRALLQHALRAFFRHGERVVELSTDSRTGALGLYAHVGMSVRRSYTHYAKELS